MSTRNPLPQSSALRSDRVLPAFILRSFTTNANHLGAAAGVSIVNKDTHECWNAGTALEGSPA